MTMFDGEDGGSGGGTPPSNDPPDDKNKGTDPNPPKTPPTITKPPENKPDAMETFLKSVGIENVGDLTSLVKDHQDQQEKDKSELQKALDKITSLETKVTDSEDKYKELENKNQTLQLTNAITNYITSNGLQFHNIVQDVIPNVLGSIEIKDGEVVGIKEAIDKLVEDNPHYLKETGGSTATRSDRKTGNNEGGKQYKFDPKLLKTKMTRL